VSSHRAGGSAAGQEASVPADGTDGSGRASGSPRTEGPRTPFVLPAHRASHSHIFTGHARESQTPLLRRLRSAASTRLSRALR